MNIAAKVLFFIGIYIRNKSLWPYYKNLLTTDYSDINTLKRIQTEKLKELLVFAYENTNYYKKLFENNNICPYKTKSLEDLRNIPLISKSELIAHNTEIQSTYKFNKQFLSETSGTTGTILKIYRNEEWESGHRAAILRGYSWYGIMPWERNGYLWGYNYAFIKKLKTKILDLLQNRYRLFSYNQQEIKKFIKKLRKSRYLHGYSSMLYQVAKLINQNEEEKINHIQMIIGTSEKILELYQLEVYKAFGRRIISEYGATEAGIIAFECPEGNMHIVMENVIVEEIDGQIVVTNLLSKSFPIIRYKLGDYIKLDESKNCNCGRQHSIILSIEGRVGKTIYGKNGHYPSLTFYYVFKNLALNEKVDFNYQVIQERKGYIIIKIEQVDDEYIGIIQKELFKYFNNDIEYDIVFGQSLYSFKGKFQDFISYID